jgi:hypothetical protein
MTVRLLISYLLLFCRSFKDSSKSAATSADVDAPEREPLGEWEDMITSLSHDNDVELGDKHRNAIYEDNNSRTLGRTGAQRRRRT